MSNLRKALLIICVIAIFIGIATLESYDLPRKLIGLGLFGIVFLVFFTQDTD